MDFSFTEEQEAVRDLAAQILQDQVSQERLKAVTAGSRFDRETWVELAKANLLGISLPEDVGGSGLGFLETCLVLEQVGRSVAFVPVLSTIVMAALAIAEFGTAEQRSRLLPQVVSGDAVMTAALVEPGGPATGIGASFTTTSRRDGATWVLDGVKLCVPFGRASQHVLVPASTADGSMGVWVVETDAPGVTLADLETTSSVPESRLQLNGVVVGDADLLGDLAAGPAIVRWIADRTTVGLCLLTVGVCEEALRLTAEYAKTREQFDKPIASFQAVGQRAAEAYIDTEGVRLTAWQAAWRLSAGLPASEEVAIAKYWAAEGGQRVVHAAQHLHGGIGVDRDYPLHRYFLWAKHLELTLGGATAQLLRLGAILAAEPVEV